MKHRKAAKTGRSIRRKLLMRIIGLLGACAMLALALYAGFLYLRMETRFASRRWSIPSKVFSDTMLLFPGQRYSRSLFIDKLRRLNYREVPKRPTQMGQMRVTSKAVEVFLNQLHTPSGQRPGFPVSIHFRKGAISRIERLDTSTSVPLLELEPEEIMLFFGPQRERRQLVAIHQVPSQLVRAVMAAEDHRFYEHHGVDPRGILRAIWTNLRQGRIRQGGSTITQQLAKNYFLTPERTLSRKLKELLIALIMELRYGKDEILEIYLNEIYLGQRGSVSINGIGEAAQFYFSKPVEALDLNEAAILAGLIKAPNLYSPKASPARCQQRRDAVLKSMRHLDWIGEQALQTALAQPIPEVTVGAQGRKAPYFMDYLALQLSELYDHEDLTSLGLAIYTTLDPEVQRAAEMALSKGLQRLERSQPGLGRVAGKTPLQGAAIVMQPKTGYILAMVGGRDYGQSQFNRIVQAHRQPGSVFKPFVYLSALDRYTPASPLSNAPHTYIIDNQQWQPQNFAPVAEALVPLRMALAQSINRPTVDLALKVGLENVIHTARRFQISTPLKPLPSLALGAFEMIPLEVARAYCAFAADGVLPYPLSLKRVADDQGQMLTQRHMTVEPATTAEKAFLMNSMLRSAATEGTARALRSFGIDFPVAGKTGTTSNYKDAWFVAYTPDVLALVWVGFDDGRPLNASGAAAALPIWAELMHAIPQHRSGHWFRQPEGVVKTTICSQSGQRALQWRCPAPVEEYFLAENAPSQDCPLHRSIGGLEKLLKGVKKFVDRW